jgi:hypothetical protein
LICDNQEEFGDLEFEVADLLFGVIEALSQAHATITAASGMVLF